MNTNETDLALFIIIDLYSCVFFFAKRIRYIITLRQKQISPLVRICMNWDRLLFLKMLPYPMKEADSSMVMGVWRCKRICLDGTESNFRLSVGRHIYH